jgi:predicted  nucleic acid-binding Zn-ribbon protein
MNHRSRAISAIFALVVASAFWVHWNPSPRPALDSLHRDIDDLKAQIEGCNTGLAAIKAQLESRNLGISPRSSSLDALMSQGSRIEELLRQQSNTTALIQRLIAATPEAQEPAQTAERAQQVIQGLEQSLSEFRQRLDVAEEKVSTLVTQLAVPPEVATLGIASEDDPNLQKYLAFFQAKRERDTARRIYETLQLRIAQEQVDAAISR